MILRAISPVRAQLRVQSRNYLSRKPAGLSDQILATELFPFFHVPLTFFQKKIEERKKEVFREWTHSVNFDRCYAYLISCPNLFCISQYVTSTFIRIIIKTFLISDKGLLRNGVYVVLPRGWHDVGYNIYAPRHARLLKVLIKGIT